MHIRDKIESMSEEQGKRLYFAAPSYFVELSDSCTGLLSQRCIDRNEATHIRARRRYLESHRSVLCYRELVERESTDAGSQCSVMSLRLRLLCFRDLFKIRRGQVGSVSQVDLAMCTQAN